MQQAVSTPAVLWSEHLKKMIANDLVHALGFREAAGASRFCHFRPPSPVLIAAKRSRWRNRGRSCDMRRRNRSVLAMRDCVVAYRLGDCKYAIAVRRAAGQAARPGDEENRGGLRVPAAPA
jgi:hypothetical protein